MSSRFAGIGPYNSFRTPNTIRPMDASLVKPKVPCKKCGATLRPTNPGPLCCPCEGAVAIPEWAPVLLTLDDRPQTLHTLAAVLLGEHRRDWLVERNESIREAFASGESKSRLAKRYVLTWQHVHQIVTTEANPKPGPGSKGERERNRRRDDSIRAYYASGKWSWQELAREFGLSKQAVGKILHRGES